MGPQLVTLAFPIWAQGQQSFRIYIVQLQLGITDTAYSVSNSVETYKSFNNTEAASEHTQQT